MRRLGLLALACVAALPAPAHGAAAPPPVDPAAVPLPAPAPPPPAANPERRIAGAAIGVGDQHLTLFGDPFLRAAGLRRARYFVPYDAIERPDALQRLLVYVRNARTYGADVLVHVYTNDLRVGHGDLPSVARYRALVGRLVAFLRPYGVTTWGVWNEANHRSEPTWDHPARAAAYAAALHDLCRGCDIVDLDVLDVPSAPRYLDRFVRALPASVRRRRVVIGIHNYGDVNRGSYRRTTAIVRAARRRLGDVRFWLTETGGLVQYGPSFPCSPRRAAQSTRRLVALLEHFRGTIDRAYVYNWIGTDCTDGFDAGLLDARGRPRPSYAVLRRALAAERAPSVRRRPASRRGATGSGSASRRPSPRR